MTLKQNNSEEIPLLISCSSISTEINKTGSWRFLRPVYEEKTAPCSSACPAGEDIPRIEMLACRGLIKEAWEVILLENPFPAVCGRVCFHPCETACNRTQFDEPVAIRRLERFLGDTAVQEGMKLLQQKLPDNGKNICIVGAGPAGLAAGYFLTRLGYSCDIFEDNSEAGGILRWGIPRYRLPDTVLRNEIARIEDFGVTIQCNTPVTPSFLKTARSRYSASFIGCGLGRSLQMKIPGEEMAFDGIEFLNTMRLGTAVDFHGAAAVVGGGNTAVDVARSLVRLGAKTILVYRRRKQDMPAFHHEVEMAVKEGVEIIELAAPVRIEKEGDAYILTLQQMTVTDKGFDNGRARVVPDGEAKFHLRARKIFTAIGAEADKPWRPPTNAGDETLTLSHCSMSVRGWPMVFGGDLTNQTKSVPDAIASGKQAAMALDTFFRKGFDAITERLASCRVGNGNALSMEKYMDEGTVRATHTVSYQEINIDYFSRSSQATPSNLSPDQRIRSFSEIESRLTFNQAMDETRRCFNCGICNACDNCRLFCPEMAVKHHDTRRQVDLDYCKGCGICVTECPRNAMTLKEER